LIWFDWVGVLPSSALDLKRYEGTSLGGNREELYSKLKSETDKLSDTLDQVGEGDMLETAQRVRDSVLSQMMVVRDIADQCEELISDDLYPFPKYQQVLYSHMSEPVF